MDFVELQGAFEKFGEWSHKIKETYVYKQNTFTGIQVITISYNTLLTSIVLAAGKLRQSNTSFCTSAPLSCRFWTCAMESVDSFLTLLQMSEYVAHTV
ncbi:hypothetical protein AVEN_204085-1 [Araneus ventricosus]|uniref:Uncharacterized protein n=1 Tax=Araneus ventricosus TaxID=182803 RepID=A0A4Y2NR13_ARAVE|nr:hypothetical protein AVEN_204085-1 [Araneus ventricosus]